MFPAVHRGFHHLLRVPTGKKSLMGTLFHDLRFATKSIIRRAEAGSGPL
jgi:hypothetical protein